MAQTLHLFPLGGQAKYTALLSAPCPLTPGPSTPAGQQGGRGKVEAGWNGEGGYE